MGKSQGFVCLGAETGVGEWDDHTLYIALPSNQNRVGTFDVGVPYRSWNGGAFEVIR